MHLNSQDCHRVPGCDLPSAKSSGHRRGLRPGHNVQFCQESLSCLLFIQTAHCLFGRGLEKGKYIVCGGDTEQELLPSQQQCTQQLLKERKTTTVKSAIIKEEYGELLKN